MRMYVCRVHEQVYNPCHHAHLQGSSSGGVAASRAVGAAPRLSLTSGDADVDVDLIARSMDTTQEGEGGTTPAQVSALSNPRGTDGMMQGVQR